MQEDHLQNSGFHLKDKSIKCYWLQGQENNVDVRTTVKNVISILTRFFFELEFEIKKKYKLIFIL